MLSAGELASELPEGSEAHVVTLEDEAVLYHQVGGYLTAINDIARDGEVATATLRTYSDWVRGDALKLRRREAFLREVLLSVTKRYSSQVTWNALARDLSIDHPTTVAEYCLLLERMDALRIVPALREDTLGPAPKKARKLYFADPFVHRSIRRFLGLEDRHAGEGGIALELEAAVLGHLARRFPAYYIKDPRGEVDAAWVESGRVHAIEVKWTRQVRPEDLRLIRRRRHALVAARVRRRHELEGVPVLPAPVVLLRLARMAAGS